MGFYLSKLTIMFVCLDQLCNKLVGNKSSSLMFLLSFKAKEGRVTRPVQGLFKSATLDFKQKTSFSPFTEHGDVIMTHEFHEIEK